MTEPTGGFIWYELMTTDADAAQGFYADVVGWRVTDSGLASMDYRILNAADGPVGGIMQLSEEMLEGGAHPGWLAYIAVEDVDAAAESIKGAGGSVIVGPSDIPDVGRFAMVTDPQGIPIYVMRTTSDDSGQAFEPTTDGHCAWNELATPDLEGALSFYTRQFGWELGETMPMGDMGNYQMINRRDEPIGAMMTAGANGSPPMWRFYFRVPSLESAVEKIKANNAAVLHGPQDVPGDDEIVIGTDPQGAMFALVAKRA